MFASNFSYTQMFVSHKKKNPSLWLTDVTRSNTIEGAHPTSWWLLAPEEKLINRQTPFQLTPMMFSPRSSSHCANANCFDVLSFRHSLSEHHSIRHQMINDQTPNVVHWTRHHHNWTSRQWWCQQHCGAQCCRHLANNCHVSHAFINFGIYILIELVFFISTMHLKVKMSGMPLPHPDPWFRGSGNSILSMVVAFTYIQLS